MSAWDEVAPPPEGGVNTPEYSVAELSGALKRTLEDAFGYVRVRGELSRLSRPASGHVYVDLKDERAVLSAVMWKGTVQKLKIKPEEGLEVIATGRITTFPGQSKYQLVIDRLEPAGLGALMLLLEERRKKLAAEGLFDAARKRPLPYLPRVIGVVTSPTGAVIRDILHRLADRFPVHVLVWPVRVQGDTSAAEVAAAIEGFNALEPGGPIPRPDVLIVARGGGSVEDLWSFNEEIVVRAAAASAIPLISAVGHETDTTLIDHASDRRAPTPTAAAEMAVPVRGDLVAALNDLGGRLGNGVYRRLDRARRDLAAAARALPDAERLLMERRQRLDTAVARLGQGLRLNAAHHRRHLERLAVRHQPSLLKGGIERRRERLLRPAARLDRALAVERRRRQEALSGLARRLQPRMIAALATRGRERLTRARERLDQASRRRLETAGGRLESLSKLLLSLSYQGVLARGFALVRDEKGEPVRRAAGIAAGASLRLEFADGERVVMATDADPDGSSDEGGDAASSRRPPTRRSTARPAGGQGSLF